MQQQRSAADNLGGPGIQPFVADHVRAFQVQVPLEGRFREQADLRFAAGTPIRFVMRTDEDVVQRKTLPEQRVHPVQFAAEQVAARQAGLVCRRQQNKSCRLQFLQRLQRRRIHLKLVQSQRDDLMSPLDLDQVEDAVSLKKYTRLHGSPLSKTTAEVSAARKRV